MRTSAKTFSNVLANLHNDRGGVAVSFILAFPIFLVIVAVLVQFALIANAKVAIDHAAQMAARAAVTSLPDDHPENVTAAACMALAPLSPVAPSPIAQATTLQQALIGMGVDTPDTFAGRYTYALDATNVSWSPDIDFLRSRSQEIEVKVVYRFRLTVPAAMKFVGADGTVAGVQGRFLDIVSTCRAQTSHGRQAQ